ncbi:MAG: arsenate reductase ArsC [Gammaproteobacteria bacterium]|nr:arsenate reductase ArsC [Gammaproteobacteria bacterium]
MRLLFVCTHNRCRSILAEAITRHLAGGKIEVASAGSEPARSVDPRTFKYLQARGIDTKGLMSKSWHDLGDFKPTALITLCDSAAGEPCPVVFAAAVKVHWGIPDPSKLKGSESLTKDAFNATIDLLSARVESVLAEDILQLSDQQLASLLAKVAN